MHNTFLFPQRLIGKAMSEKPADIPVVFLVRIEDGGFAIRTRVVFFVLRKFQLSSLSMTIDLFPLSRINKGKLVRTSSHHGTVSVVKL